MKHLDSMNILVLPDFEDIILVLQSLSNFTELLVCKFDNDLYVNINEELLCNLFGVILQRTQVELTLTSLLRVKLCQT